MRVGVSGDDALVEVSDRGLGLSEDELERSFEKFSRGRHATVTGTGLGLYICRKIIDAHGGRIWAARRAEEARPCRSRCHSSSATADDAN